MSLGLSSCRTRRSSYQQVRWKEKQSKVISGNSALMASLRAVRRARGGEGLD